MPASICTLNLRLRAVLVALVLLALCTLAHADVFGFIDEQGRVHFANSQVDQRYSLFFKEGERFDASRMRHERSEGPYLPATPATEAVVEASVEEPRSRFFQRVVDHPNVTRYASLIKEVARESGIDAHLIQSVIAVESGYNPGAVSPKGAIGLMQIMPDTGQRYGVRADIKQSVEQKLTDPGLNLRIGARYLADLRKMFREDLDLVLAAYNAGENAVKRYRNAIPPFPETMAYVKMVGEFYRFYKPPPPPRPLEVRAVVPIALPDVAPTAAGRLRMTLAGRRNMPDMGSLPPPDVLRVSPGFFALQPQAIPDVADGRQQLPPAATAQ